MINTLLNPKDPPHPAEKAFLQTLLHDPLDVTTRMVYSDWLEENDHELRAEFLRAQLEAASYPVSSPSRENAQQRRDELSLQVPEIWRLTLDRPHCYAIEVLRGAETVHTHLPRFGNFIYLASNPVRLGRQSPEQDNDILLLGQSISRRHVSIFHSEPGPRIQDQGSRNGTFINNIRLVQNRQQPLRHQDVGRICSVVFKFHDLGWGPPAPLEQHSPPISANDAELPQRICSLGSEFMD